MRGEMLRAIKSAAAVGYPGASGPWRFKNAERSADGNAAIDLVATTEGIFLDPVFGAKAMAALIAECRSGKVTGPVVFLVSGGGPTLFAAGEPIEENKAP